MDEISSGLLGLPDGEFLRVWRGLTQSERSQLPDGVRDSAYRKYNALTPWVGESVGRLSNAAIKFNAHFNGGAPNELPPLRGFDFQELIELAIKPRNPILGEFLTEGSIGMLHAWRGLGKTWVVMWIIICVCCGKTLFNWVSRGPRPVVYIDGEMQGGQMRERFLSICSALDAYPPPGMLQVLSRDLYEGQFINLANAADQLRLDEFIPANTALIVVDNISSLTLSEHSESDDLHWQGIAQWALRHRAAGRAVLFVHHAGKSGKQRGTSKREDLLDYVFTLKRPADYEESQGCRFTLEFEKARSIVGEAVKPFEAALSEDAEGRLVWATTGAELAINEKAVELWELGGLTLGDISGELGVHKSTISRHLTAANQAGRLKRPYPGGKKAKA